MPASTHNLKPWTELVKLHADVESGTLDEAVFAIDLGAVATGDPTTPKVYSDPDAFFAATYKGTAGNSIGGQQRRGSTASGVRLCFWFRRQHVRTKNKVWGTEKETATKFGEYRRQKRRQPTATVASLETHKDRHRSR